MDSDVDVRISLWFTARCQEECRRNEFNDKYGYKQTCVGLERS